MTNMQILFVAVGLMVVIVVFALLKRALNAAGSEGGGPDFHSGVRGASTSQAPISETLSELWPMILVWMVGSFIYFKVGFDWGFSQNISIIAALLLAAVTGIAIFWVSGAYARVLRSRVDMDPAATPPTLGAFIRPTVIVFLAAGIAHGLVARLVIFGFSKPLHQALIVFNDGHGFDQSFVLFSAVVLMPLFLHYGMVVVGAYSNAMRSRPS